MAAVLRQLVGMTGEQGPNLGLDGVRQQRSDAAQRLLGQGAQVNIAGAVSNCTCPWNIGAMLGVSLTMRGWLREIAIMDRRDRELLNKQVSHLQPETRREGLLLVTLAAVFLAGLTAGGLLFAEFTQPNNL